MADLEGIIAAYGSGLARVAASYEADPALQEDLLQDILLAIHRALPALKQQERLAPFVFRIAHNRSVTHVMQQSARRTRAASYLAEDEAETPEQVLLADERSHRLTAAVRRLPLPYRQVMTLLLEELSYAEIAEALGLSLSNVGVRVNRAKAQLKALLDDE
ncbi:sigma-70 family RNA polymerase sigma factor [Sphingosinicella sp. LHD-64]|uniref:RNA polymerase sigma factor n=1 Tax=Sphingosinicella sp. LHD-64 TaxID=3072139 RepID=UPI00280EC168|nr:sigma-70 family RNA polymerase sigma factor [Sphingosinicella sp. LHD-64]MDQ8757972.1 sigma-70 family RNA polymerase sigma factor [Sphingosinicella sp. LHD-64]